MISFSRPRVAGSARFVRFFAVLLLALLPCAGAVAARADAVPPERSTTDVVHIDNGVIRLGFKTSSGAALAHFSLCADERNVINHWDRGRLVQQSYYGTADGSLWVDKPWRWNPVQGGDWRGSPARLLELEEDGRSLRSKSYGKHWASGVDLTDVVFEQWVTLDGPVARIRFRMSYSGTVAHPVVPHELPAVFIEPRFDTLLVYEGDDPWTSQPVTRSRPGWPNESRKFTEKWAAYVDAADVGVGAFVPAADELTCYRFGDGVREHGSCSYFAPIRKFAIEPGMVFTYDVYLTIGTADEIRERFRRIHERGGTHMDVRTSATAEAGSDGVK